MDRALTDLAVAVPAPPPLEPSVLRAAAVLFAIEPRDFIRGAAVQLVRRLGIGPGPGPSSAREECSGPLVDNVDCCPGFLGRHTRRFESVTGTRRAALPEYPEAVLREAVMNALAHRDYGLKGATVDITVWGRPHRGTQPGTASGPHHHRQHARRALQPQPSHHAGSEDDGTGRRVRPRALIACTGRWSLA